MTTPAVTTGRPKDTVTEAAPSRRRRAMTWRPGCWGMLFISPWLLGFLIFTAGPMLASLYLSFCKYDLHALKWVGGKNYEVLLTRDPIFWKSLTNTALYVLFSVPTGLTGSLLIALLLNRKVRGVALFRGPPWPRSRGMRGPGASAGHGRRSRRAGAG